MKTPFVLLAVLFIQAEAFTVKEQRYFNFVIMNNKINKIANNVTTYLESVNDDVYQLALNFHANMSEIREKYGPMSYDYYDRKYSRLAHEFATKMSLSRDCAGYVADVLANNEKYQNITSELLDSILHYFKIEYEKIYAKMIDIRKALTEEEVDAFKCSTTFTGGDKDDHWNCAESVRIISFYR
ncbi:uncharacterized protein [Fopius arisanus]|uniref:Uncharacterized protein n=1 Tax=Fopius arisanus TaxID=64838 RepID=A0A9R1TBM5_9HYME|nr:PREDICTED: uncharacterized protein LOC105268386 [Fopius arisanus]